MRNTEILLDKAKRLCTPESDYELARRLEVTPQRLSNWRCQNSVPDNEVAFRLAKLLRMPVADVIGYFEEDKANTPKKKAFWKNQLPRVLSSIAIGAALLHAAGGSLIDDAGAAVRRGAALPGIHYAKFKRRLRRRAHPAPACGC